MRNIERVGRMVQLGGPSIYRCDGAEQGLILIQNQKLVAQNVHDALSWAACVIQGVRRMVLQCKAR